MEKKVYILKINEDVNSPYELQAISLVDSPAIEELFVSFSEEKVMLANIERRIISGPVLIPNKLIERNNEKGNYYLTMSKETIQELAIKYFKKSNTNNVTIMHNQQQPVDGVTMFEMFIADKSRGVNHLKGFENLEDGTMYASFFIENNEVWEQVKNGSLKGFSIEGLFNVSEPQNEDEILLQKIIDVLK